MGKRIILIGGLSNLQGALPTITQAIINSSILREDFVFIPHFSARVKGIGKFAALNLTNIEYFFKHYASWVYLLYKHRPHAAHYPITSFWNFPKSIAFLATAKLVGCRIIGHLHGGAFHIFWNMLPRVLQICARRVLNLLDGLIVLGEGWKDYMISIGFVSKIFVLPNTIDKHFARQQFLPPFQNKKVSLFFLGRIGEPKGVATLLRAMKAIQVAKKDLRLILAGPEENPGDFERMRALASRLLPDKFYEFTGPLYGEEKIRAFSESDIFVFPSNYENFPLVIIEAMAAGRPIICTPVGAVPEYLEHGVSGLFVHAGDPDDLAVKIEWMLAYPREAIEMGKRARNIFQERLLHEKVLEKLKRIYFAILDGA